MTRQRRISFPADAVLHAVVQEGDMVELHRLLNQHDEDININQTNHMGLTALHHSVLTNNLDATKLLLCEGADVGIQDSNGCSPLHAAAGCGFLQIASILVAFGADVYRRDNNGDYPLDLCKDEQTAEFLFDEMLGVHHRQTYWQYLCLNKLKDLWYFIRTQVQHFLILFGVFLKYSMERCAHVGHDIFVRYVLGSIGPPARDKTE